MVQISCVLIISSLTNVSKTQYYSLQDTIHEVLLRVNTKRALVPGFTFCEYLKNYCMYVYTSCNISNERAEFSSCSDVALFKTNFPPFLNI